MAAKQISAWLTKSSRLCACTTILAGCAARSVPAAAPEAAAAPRAATHLRIRSRPAAASRHSSLHPLHRLAHPAPVERLQQVSTAFTSNARTAYWS